MGWPARRWSVRAPCCVCDRWVTRGVVHPKDTDDPPKRAMCHRCVTRLMTDPEHFEDSA